MLHSIRDEGQAKAEFETACRPADRSPSPLLHERVHARAATQPGALAVVAGSRSVNYGELDRRANALASDLRARGVGPDVVVGLLADRSPEMILGALAILKAGGAYLPLDAAYPTDRLAFICRDARCTLLVGTPGVSEQVRDALPPIAVTASFDGPQAPEPPRIHVTPERLAYVIYTSGSTGRPKGVEIAHASLANLVSWHCRTFGITASDRAPQLAALGFDAAVWETWPYLASGASLHLPSDAVRGDPERLRNWLIESAITIGFVPTPMAARLLTLPWPEQAALRILLTGGDVLHGYPPPDLPFVLVNAYGPTECTVVATCGPVEPFARPDERPTIGRPIDGTEVAIVDESMQPVPAGSVGEIYVGGAGLARGYRNRPDLTSAKFVRAAIGGGAEQRWYRTGDLGRFLPTGAIAFLGRADDQIKINGFRVEPNEIVTTLNRQPGVTASAVTANDVGGGDKRLVAYLVLAAGASLRPTELQAALRKSLPDYMVPGTFVRLDALPVGPNGKVQSGSLPEPTPANTLRDTPFEPPRTPIEERVADLVASLWRISDVSVHDNLFLLGGHSLIATQLIGRVRQAFSVELSLRTVFGAPSVAALSREIERLLQEKVSAMSEDEARALLATKTAMTDAAQ